MSRSASTPDDRRHPRPGRGLFWGIGGAVLASLCCAGPLVAVLVGVGGATGAVGLVRFKWEFLAAGLVVTLAGVALSLRRTKTCCSVTTYRRNRVLLPAVGVLTFLLLALGSQRVLLNDHVLGLASARLQQQTQAQEGPARLAAPAGQRLDVAITSGVDCVACLMAIQQQLADTPGVAGAGFVRNPAAPFVLQIDYDPARVSQAKLLTAIATAPGSVGGRYGTKVLHDAPLAPVGKGNGGAAAPVGNGDGCC